MSTAERYAAILAELAAVDAAAATDGQRIDSLTWLERIKSAAAAAQARLTDSFAVSQREKLIKAGAKSQDASRSITAQVALARKDGPHTGSRHVGLAATLVHEMPRVLDTLGRGETSEWRCTIIARETAHLSAEQRAEIDAAIADQLHG
ncbi:MAG TPA: hypothetical protein VIU11_16800 [Nakamurella sp.]